MSLEMVELFRIPWDASIGGVLNSVHGSLKLFVGDELRQALRPLSPITIKFTEDYVRYSSTIKEVL